MSDKPLISVVVPIYNVEQYLKRCVDSIRCQTYSNLEIVLVNDGSTDNCGKFVMIIRRKIIELRLFIKKWRIVRRKKCWNKNSTWRVYHLY